VNWARANLGFDEQFKALIASARAGWKGTFESRPLRVWANFTCWDTFAVAKEEDQIGRRISASPERPP